LKTFEKVNENHYHEKRNDYYKNKRDPIMARFSSKAIHTVRHVYLTYMTALLMWQTQRFIMTLSPLWDRQPLPNKNTM